jgi:hypothetical protein
MPLLLILEAICTMSETRQHWAGQWETDNIHLAVDADKV